VVASRYLQPNTRVAIIDDFLANGRTAVALAEIVEDAGATTVVAGFLVEKLFQDGRAPLESMGIPVATLAQVKKLYQGRVIMAGDEAE
jgi:xanthine phosphoribosyltransferase